MMKFFNSRVKSLGYALKGLKEFFSTQVNSWIEIAASLVVIFAGFYFNITTSEWLAIVLCVGLVFVAEIINTSIEYLCNYVSTELNPIIGKVKDLAAGAVLFASIISFIITLIIFWKYIF
jgi:diacylglycerol kinase (ATP)